jgi:hypothetical protein
MQSINPRPTKICEICKKPYEKPKRLGISHWKKRRFCSKECQYEDWSRRKNEQCYAWKGENVLVYTKHQWLYKNYGKADRCDNPKCEHRSNKFEWALKKGFKYEKKRENYMKLCKVCHFKYDFTGEKRQKILDILLYYSKSRGGVLK